MEVKQIWVIFSFPERFCEDSYLFSSNKQHELKQNAIPKGSFKPLLGRCTFEHKMIEKPTCEQTWNLLFLGQDSVSETIQSSRTNTYGS